MTGSWEQVLDRMEERLVAAARVAGEEPARVEPFALPPGLGPLPPRLRDRAAAILEATEVMERRLTVGMFELAARIRAAGTVGSAADRPPPTYVNRVV